MRGWLVVNGFTATPKFIELYEWLERAAQDEGVLLERKTTLEVATSLHSYALDMVRPDFVIFWDKDVRLCRALEIAGCLCLNSSRAIALCDNKSDTYLELLAAGLPQPKTILTPKVFHAQDWSKTDYGTKLADQLGLPFVLKECYGSFGAQVHLAHSADEAGAILNSMEERPSLAQEFVQTSTGRDIRLQVVGGQVVAAMERVSETGDFRANVTNGAVAREWTPTNEQASLAVRACEVLGLDFGGVDLLFGPDEEPVICEVNSNAHFINLYKVSGIDIAPMIIRHAINRCLEG